MAVADNRRSTVGAVCHLLQSGMTPLWRWGVPATAALAAVAAAGFALAWATTADDRFGEIAAAATGCAATLLVCWTAVGRAPVPETATSRSEPASYGRLTEAVLATVVVLPIVILVATRLRHPVAGDEQMLMMDYANRSFADVVGTYRNPNHHVLHTLLGWLAHQLGGWDVVVFRLPAFLAFCLLLPATWWFVRRDYGPAVAGFATAFFGTAPLLVQYAAIARGYTMMLLFFVTALLCAQSLARKPESKALWAIWSAAVALGFYTIPLMVVPAATTVAWMLLVRWREHGGKAVGPLAARAAAWSAVAAAGAALLYAPIVVACGVEGFYTTLAAEGPRYLFLDDSARPDTLALPIDLWHAWNFKHPSWVKGALCGLVLAGLAVPGRRSAGRPSRSLFVLVLAMGLGTGVVTAAMGIATGQFMLTRPYTLIPRLTLWMIPVFMLAAGVGAAFVLERAVARAGARWPWIGGSAGRSIAICGAAFLVVGALALSSSRPGIYMDPYGPQRELPALVLATAERMEPGDHFTVHNWIAHYDIFYMRHLHEVDDHAGFYHTLGTPESRRSVHQVASEGNSRPKDRPPRPPTNLQQGRLFVHDVFEVDEPRAKRFLEASRSDHELVAAFHGKSVHVVDDWVKHPWDKQGQPPPPPCREPRADR